jgi:hypothetical protein
MMFYWRTIIQTVLQDLSTLMISAYVPPRVHSEATPAKENAKSWFHAELVVALLSLRQLF